MEVRSVKFQGRLLEALKKELERRQSDTESLRDWDITSLVRELVRERLVEIYEA